MRSCGDPVFYRILPVRGFGGIIYSSVENIFLSNITCDFSSDTEHLKVFHSV